MTDTSTNGAAAGAGTEAPVQPRLQVLGQYIKDLSFENIAAQKAAQANEQPDIQVQVNLDAKKRQNAENQYEVAIKLKIEAKTKTSSEMILIIELDYAGIFLIEHVMQAVMSLSDFTYVLNNGQLIASGTPQQVAADPQVIEAYLGQGASHLKKDQKADA